MSRQRNRGPRAAPIGGELADRLEASGYEIPASEIHLPCPVKAGQGNNGYKTVEELLPEGAE